MAALAGLAIGAEKSPRRDVLINGDWKFIQQDVAGAEAPDFNDASWEAVQIPHSWNITAGQKGDKKAFYTGIGWYRLHLVPEALWAGRRVYLKFDAAAFEAEVFVGGKSVGKHTGGFLAFCFDVTPLITLRKDNVIAVKLDNTRCNGAPDFTRFGGLYRNVHVLVLDPLSITPLDSAGPGVYLRQKRADAETAEVEVTALVRNASADERSATVRCSVLDREGREVASATAKQKTPAGASADVKQTLSFEKPHLWNGRQDPYLYRA
ncbi:MAG: beta galactosidase jelly roll domain-containing protein, partial [Planctomycetota bacterium]|nr:beta galactosidase jelly roll domain-containing protein [Planctomycetota bacterium]